MASKLRDKALNAKDLRKELLAVPAWDLTLEIRGLTARLRAAMVERATVKTRGEDGEEVSSVDSKILNPLLIIASCYDPETGERVFDDTDGEGIENKSAESYDLITSCILRLNGMDKAERKVMEKNSGATDTAAIASGSPSN